MKYSSRFFVLPLVALLASTALAQVAQKAAPVRDRITAAVEDSDVAMLPNSQHPRTRVLPDLGPVSAQTELERVTMVFKLSAAQQADLETLLQQQQNPRSPNYHKWLTPAQYHQRFGISDADLATVKQWLQSNGLVVNEEATDNSMAVFSGNAAQIGRAFHTEIHRYQGATETHYANSSDISIPAALSNIVLGVRALDDFRPRPRPHVKRSFTSSISKSHFLVPDDLATIYNLRPLFNAGITGTGQKIAVVGQSDINLTDIRTFRSLSGLPASDPQVVLISSDPGIQSGDVDESSLDIEWAGATAPGATIVFVNSTNVFNSLQYAIQNDVAPVISVSYGDCEQNFSTSQINSTNALLQQANAQGQTVVSAAGDSGAEDCDYSGSSHPNAGLAVDFPPSSPNVTAIGGSTLNDGPSNADGSSVFWTAANNTNNGSAISYIPEVAWNDTAIDGSPASTGGGASIKFGKPSWQTGMGVPNDSARDLPDITFSASADHDGYLICSQNTCMNGYRQVSSDPNVNNSLNVAGGTSVGTPIFAGVVALLNQKLNSSQGNINPAMYALAATSSDAFHDIVSGDNKIPCTSGVTGCSSGASLGFSAGVGYDQVTGLGSINIANFVNELSGGSGSGSGNPDFQLSAASSILTLVHGNSTTDVLTISALNGFSSNVALTCTTSASLGASVCSISPGSVSGSGSATLTVTASSALASARPGHDHGLPMAPFWASSAFGLMALVFAGKTGAKPNKALCSIALIAMISLVGIGCGGGGSSSTPNTTNANTATPVTGNVIVTGTSGSTSHSIQLSITVN